MSMFVVSEDCLNDVANLIVKLYPYMNLKEVFQRLLKLNIEVWNNKYNQDDNIDDFNYDVVDYSEFVYESNMGLTKFKDDYYNVQLPQLVESLCCYNYQIEENYINSLDCRFTYSLIKEIYNNPLIEEMINYINYNKLNEFVENKDKRFKVCGVNWNR